MAGPRKGWKQRLNQPEDTTPPVALTFEQRNNPAMLEGDALRHLAWTLGMAKSDIARMDDDKVREQIAYLTANRYAVE